MTTQDTKTMSYAPLVLLILDGWGISAKKKGNPFTTARTPVYTHLWTTQPHTRLTAHGRAVGLPENQPGNSEAGHSNIGAGRIVLQDVVYISRSINDGTFFKNPALIEAIHHARRNKSRVHIMGLLGNENSPHADPDHLLALLTLLRESGTRTPVLHLFTDGRDSPPYKSLEFYHKLERSFHNGETVGTIMGRAWAMDRRGSWKRTAAAYRALVYGEGRYATSVEDAIAQSYQHGESNEFITPTIITNAKKTIRTTIQENDSLIFYNLRSDRARQLTKAFMLPNMPNAYTKLLGRKRTLLHNVRFVAMTDFGPDLPNVLTAFPSRDVPKCLPYVLQNKRQLYIAEAEKFAHVTYFLNGGYDHPVGGEDRVMIKSPDIIHYDRHPEMQLSKLTNILVQHLKRKTYDVLVANFPNADMLGHTGLYEAGVKGIEAVDRALAQIRKVIQKAHGTLIVTADHCNVEEMGSEDMAGMITQHSCNPVPFIIADYRGTIAPYTLKKYGILADIAPTILEVLNMQQPREMTGKSLIKASKVK